ncbi:hypothetical protein GJ496_011733 [Pomphorhynchus laevis]|nr:hypothetical protein GJ496_011733 [Pomphorhynchus laevis]
MISPNDCVLKLTCKRQNEGPLVCFSEQNHIRIKPTPKHMEGLQLPYFAKRKVCINANLQIAYKFGLIIVEYLKDGLFYCPCRLPDSNVCVEIDLYLRKLNISYQVQSIREVEVVRVHLNNQQQQSIRNRFCLIIDDNIPTLIPQETVYLEITAMTIYDHSDCCS